MRFIAGIYEHDTSRLLHRGGVFSSIRDTTLAERNVGVVQTKRGTNFVPFTFGSVAKGCWLCECLLIPLDDEGETLPAQITNMIFKETAKVLCRLAVENNLDISKVYFGSLGIHPATFLNLIASINI